MVGVGEAEKNHAVSVFVSTQGFTLSRSQTMPTEMNSGCPQWFSEVAKLGPGRVSWGDSWVVQESSSRGNGHLGPFWAAVANQWQVSSVRWSMTMDDVPGCNHLRGPRTLAGGEAGRWQGPVPTCGSWLVSSLNLNTWKYIKLKALEKVIIT